MIIDVYWILGMINPLKSLFFYFVVAILGYYSLFCFLKKLSYLLVDFYHFLPVKSRKFSPTFLSFIFILIFSILLHFWFRGLLVVNFNLIPKLTFSLILALVFWSILASDPFHPSLRHNFWHQPETYPEAIRYFS